MTPGAEDRLNGPCIRGTPTGPCGAKETRPYPAGALCSSHAPWALAGRPEPGSHPKTDDEQIESSS